MNGHSVRINIFKNSLTSGITFILSIFMKFLVRTFFIKFLGEQYLGLNGLFSSILQMLSLTDLGMDAAFSFVLYKPIVNDNKDEIFKIVKNLKKVYEIVGLLVLIIGLMIVPFLKNIIGIHNQNLDNVILIYFIFLTNSVSSYFFTYNRTLLNADQRNYVVTLITFWVTVVGNIVQIVILINFKSPVLFSVVDLGITIISNFFINISVKKYYPFISRSFDKKEIKLDNHTKNSLIKNSIGGLSNKIGTIVVFSSDNILISLFVGLSTVGLYSNYTMIINSVSGLVSRVIQPMTSSIGSMSIREPEKSLQFFEKFNTLIYSVLLFSVPQVFILLSPFIQWWIGKGYVLSIVTTILIVLNITLQIMRQPSLTFIDAYGLQWIQKWKSIIESIINISMSLIFVWLFHFGLNGILLGTIFSTILTVAWYEPYVVFKYGLNNFIMIIKFTYQYFKGLCAITLAVLLGWFLTKNIQGEGLIFLITLSLIVFGGSIIIYSVFYLKLKSIRKLFYNLLK